MRKSVYFIALMLVGSFVDEQYFFGHYTRAVTSMAAQMAHFFYR